MANLPEPPTTNRSAREIFLRVMEADGATAREALIASTCGGDVEIRREVEDLIDQGSEVVDFLESPAAVSLREPPKVGLPTAVVQEGSGDVIGPFKLLDLLGEGGCGMVYAADQQKPVRRQVALKIIKLGMDTKSVIARFESERQALALMDHPNIAKVFDAGATENGRPYFVMELVHGVPITNFCDQQKLSTRERLQLFIQVCNAIQHAHQKGIIHRDIKPSNILIAEGDHGPVPKVIDFGIAKATEQRLTEHTLFTAVESFIGTPTYMSPEQAEVGGIDIDTRSDLYSLGVLLNELLVGRTPFDAAELQRMSLDGMRRTIRETEPERPSQAFAKLPWVEQERVAECHDCDPPKLLGVLRGDLDWIVNECLEKDRSRRYAAASDLVADIERHLNSQPVLARPPSTIYRAGKLLRRHGGAIAAGLLLLLTLLAGITVSTTQAIRATHAEKEAREGRDLQERLRAKAERGELIAREAAAAKDLNEYVADINLAQLALSEGNFGRARQLVDKHLPATGEIDHRGFEWRYLAERCLGDAHVALPNQGSAVRCLAYSGDGKILAVGMRDEIRLWDVRSRSLITSLPGGARSLLFLRDGRTLVSADQGTTWVVDTSSWLEVAELRGSGDALALSPDGSQLATSGADGIQVWDTRDWFEILRFPETFPGPVAFSPDGKSLIGACLDGIASWSLQDGSRLMTLEDSTGLVGGDSSQVLAFSADGKHVIAPRNNNSVRGVFVLSLWDAETGEEVGSMPGHSGTIASVDSAGRGSLLATASLDHSVGLWDTERRGNLFRLTGHRSEVLCVELSPNGGSVASGSKDGDVRIWPTSPPSEPDSIEGKLTPLSFSPDGRRLAVLDENAMLRSVRLPALELTSAVVAARPASISGDLKVFGFARDDGMVELRKLDGSGDRTIRVDSGQINFLKLLPDGNGMLTQGGLQPLEFRDLKESDEAVLSLRAKTALVSADGETLAAFGIGNTVGIWDLPTRRQRIEFLVAQSVGSSAGLSSDGRLLATSHGLADSENLVSLWDAASGELLSELSGHKQSVRSIAFTPDGRTLVTASDDGSLKFWNIATRQELLSVRRLGSSLRELQFSPDGQWLVGSSSGDEGTGELRFFRAPGR
ncbi:MAG: WD40 repeat protein/serine/threonine protein kinase [Verrucomicrobiales bacterium]|jgi:WD40 repeat protein/serine/threonine protein kinase